jgi:hypothetical protein
LAEVDGGVVYTLPAAGDDEVCGGFVEVLGTAK